MKTYLKHNEPFRKNKKICRKCGKHKALSKYRGRWAFRDGHNLCPACFESLCDSIRAKALANRPKEENRWN